MTENKIECSSYSIRKGNLNKHICQVYIYTKDGTATVEGPFLLTVPTNVNTVTNGNTKFSYFTDFRCHNFSYPYISLQLDFTRYPCKVANTNVNKRDLKKKPILYAK